MLPSQSPSERTQTHQTAMQTELTKNSSSSKPSPFLSQLLQRARASSPSPSRHCRWLNSSRTLLKESHSNQTPMRPPLATSTPTPNARTRRERGSRDDRLRQSIYPNYYKLQARKINQTSDAYIPLNNYRLILHRFCFFINKFHDLKAEARSSSLSSLCSPYSFTNSFMLFPKAGLCFTCWFVAKNSTSS